MTNGLLDLNLIDCHVRDAMLDLYQKQQPRAKNISQLEVHAALHVMWNDLPHDPIDKSILSYTKRLTACI